MSTHRTPTTQNDGVSVNSSSSVRGTSNKRPRTVQSPTSDSETEMHSQDPIMVMLTNWKTEQESVLAKLINDVAEIKSDIQQVHKTNSEIEKTLEFICKNHEELKNKVDSLEKNQEDRNKHIEKLEDRIEELERNARSTYLEIRGIPEKSNETKNDLLSIMDNVHNTLKLEVERGFIRNIYRARGKPNAERPIVMDVTTPLKKYQLLQAVKKYNQNHINDRLNTTAVGLGTRKIPIYFSDFLTPKAKRLYFLARDVSKTHNYRFCWSINGKVFMRKSEGCTAINITSEQQLEDLKGKK